MNSERNTFSRLASISIFDIITPRNICIVLYKPFCSCYANDEYLFYIYIQKCNVISKQPQKKLFSMKYKFIKIMKISLAQIDKGLLCEPSLFAHYLNMFLRKS